MNSIVIGKDSLAYAAKIGGGTIAGINEVNLLADGAIAVFTDKSELVTAVNVGTILADKKGIYFAVGSGDATKGSYVTTVTGRLGADYSKKAYVAPVKTVKYIGYDGTTGTTALNLPTLIAGAEAFIKLIDTTSGLRTIGTTYETEVTSYSYIVKTGDTDVIIIDALVAAINANPNAPVVAVRTGITGVTLGVSLTAKNYGQTFTISLDGILSNASKVQAEGPTTGVAVAPTYGEGTYNQILALEDMYSPGRGNTNKIYQPALWYSVPSMAVSGKTYNQYTICWTAKNDRTTGSSFTTNQTILVALPVGVAATATFETIMAQVFGVEEDAESGI